MFLLLMSGGGDSQSESFFGGIYSTHLVAIENNCQFPVEAIDRIYTVNQDATRVVVDSNTGQSFEGTATGDDSFIVSRVGVANCTNQAGEDIQGSTFQFTQTLTVSLITAESAQVTLTSDNGNCSKNTNDVTCRFRMLGTAARTK